VRTLSGTLLAAQRSASAVPYVKVEVSDYLGDMPRLRWRRLYTGSEGGYYHAVVLAGDGSLVRARIDPGTKVLYTQRVAAPGPGSDFSQWTSHGAVSATGAVALAGQGSTVLLFYVDGDGVTVKVKSSTDNGASWGSAVTVATAGSAVKYLAAAVATGGDRVVFWTVGAVVWRSRYTGGSWGAAASWTNTVATITGLACRYTLDWSVVVTGTEAGSTDAVVWQATYGDGVEAAADAWSGLTEVMRAAAGSGVTYASPAVSYLGGFRLWFVERYAGPVAYERVMWSGELPTVALFGEAVWREPEAFDYQSEYGVAMDRTAAAGWLSAPAGVWRAEFPGTPFLDVTGDVVEVEAYERAFEGGLELTLRNDDGRYNVLGSGANAYLRRGARVQVSAGYRTAAGAEVSAGPEYWVTSIEHVVGPEARLVVRAEGAWRFLEEWRARRQLVWAGSKNVAGLLEWLCRRAGLSYSTVSGSGELTGLYPAFTVHPGESGLVAVKRLLGMVPDRLRLAGGGLKGVNPLASDGAVYGYGTVHVLLRGRFRERGPEVNRAQAYGAGVFGEAMDFGEVEAMGERLEQVADKNVVTGGGAEARAGAVLRVAAMGGRADEVAVLMNVGQELWDVVEVTAVQAGLSGAKRRVVGMGWVYRTGRRPAYELELVLGAA
jgi:hypothetical protein